MRVVVRCRMRVVFYLLTSEYNTCPLTRQGRFLLHCLFTCCRQVTCMSIAFRQWNLLVRCLQTRCSLFSDKGICLLVVFSQGGLLVRCLQTRDSACSLSSDKGFCLFVVFRQDSLHDRCLQARRSACSLPSEKVFVIFRQGNLLIRCLQTRSSVCLLSSDNAARPSVCNKLLQVGVRRRPRRGRV